MGLEAHGDQRYQIPGAEVTGSCGLSHVGARNSSQVLYGISVCSQPLSHLCSSYFKCLIHFGFVVIVDGAGDGT